ncbi:hypothetical protein V6N13_011536 [Hibiscus sabdariffa]
MELFEKLREEQVRVFKQPFRNKFLNFSDGSYRWGTPTATSPRQLSWSEAFHIPMTDISSSSYLADSFSIFISSNYTYANHLVNVLTSSSMEPFATKAWSNGFYNSVEHCVVTHPTKERFSAAYFLCPSYETVTESCSQPSVYSKFSFREYRQKVQEDVQRYGYKEWLLWNEGANFPIDEVLRWIHIVLVCVQDDPAVSSAILLLGSDSA